MSKKDKNNQNINSIPKYLLGNYFKKPIKWLAHLINDYGNSKHPFITTGTSYAYAIGDEKRRHPELTELQVRENIDLRIKQNRKKLGLPTENTPSLAAAGLALGSLYYPWLAIPDIIFDTAASIDEPSTSNNLHTIADFPETVAKFTPSKIDDYVAKGVLTLGNIDDAVSTSGRNMFSIFDKKTGKINNTIDKTSVRESTNIRYRKNGGQIRKMQTAAGGPLKIKFDPERIARLEYLMTRVPGMNTSGGDRYKKEGVLALQHLEQEAKRKELEIRSRLERPYVIKQKASIPDKLRGINDEYEQTNQVVGMSGTDPIGEFILAGIGLGGIGTLAKTGAWGTARLFPTSYFGNLARLYFVGNAFKNSFNRTVPASLLASKNLVKTESNKQKRVISEGTYPMYKGKLHSVKEVVNPDGTVNPRQAMRILHEVSELFPGSYKMEYRLENPEWHQNDPTTYHHTKNVALSAWGLDVPYGFTKYDLMVAALGHDFGKIVAGDGHAQIGADLAKQVFPDLTEAQYKAIAEHMGTPKTSLGKATKAADIDNGRSVGLKLLIEKQGGKMNILEFLKNGSGIHIKEKNKGKFTSYCGGKVTDECILKGKNSSNPAIRKRATFAANARKWKHLLGGMLNLLQKFLEGGKTKNSFWKNAGDFMLNSGLALNLLGAGVNAIFGNPQKKSFDESAKIAKSEVDMLTEKLKQLAMLQANQDVLNLLLLDPANPNAFGGPIVLKVLREGFYKKYLKDIKENANQQKALIDAQSQLMSDGNTSDFLTSLLGTGLNAAIGYFGNKASNNTSTTNNSGGGWTMNYNSLYGNKSNYNNFFLTGSLPKMNSVVASNTSWLNNNPLST